ncbi:MAG: hypothetical protein ACTSYW_00580 [Candidatus Heimdallarchaeota archaeon]
MQYIAVFDSNKYRKSDIYHLKNKIFNSIEEFHNIYPQKVALFTTKELCERFNRNAIEPCEWFIPITISNIDLKIITEPDSNNKCTVELTVDGKTEIIFYNTKYECGLYVEKIQRDVEVNLTIEQRRFFLKYYKTIQEGVDRAIKEKLFAPPTNEEEMYERLDDTISGVESSIKSFEEKINLFKISALDGFEPVRQSARNCNDCINYNEA